ncbi:energy-coupling factor transporter transmembrane component T [Microbacterium marinilacus]|uniref:Energy-coupling factor transporter transmembrane component T n=1 Tax=Microbacterium marinilacus TaxID=415209 RepID=A0ABP7BJT3_9MICO|nr:energy-coupling factor transporter transmembrane component T [Microbacterium marinilacus]MBY0687646.1 energy-coupling factor transporter transmembrane protein EcfT [Microbacterium marinilacus]
MPEGGGPAGWGKTTGQRRALDPRTKILLVIACSVVVMSPAGLPFVPTVLLVAVALAVWEGARARAIGIAAAALLLWAVGWLVPLWWPNGVTAMASLVCVYAIRFTAAIGVGAHLIATTSPTQLSAAFRAWRVPRPISVTLAVMLRFFPVVGAESSAVLDAMRLRGLVGVRGMLRHPVLSLERFTVPMIAASLRASEDLSASAVLRGLGSRRTPTAMNPPRFGAPDLVLLIVVAVLAIAVPVLPRALA